MTEMHGGNPMGTMEMSSHEYEIATQAWPSAGLHALRYY